MLNNSQTDSFSDLTKNIKTTKVVFKAKTNPPHACFNPYPWFLEEDMKTEMEKPEWGEPVFPVKVIRNVATERVVKWNLPPLAFGQDFSCANRPSTTTVEIELTTPFAVVASEVLIKNMNRQDYVDGYLVDKNDVLGQGTNFVLGQFASKRRFPGDRLVSNKRDVAIMITTSGLFLRFVLTAASGGLLSAAPEGFLNIEGYNLSGLTF